MTFRERVKRAIHRTGPDRLPILFFNKGLEQSDIILIDVIHHFTGTDKEKSEWGFSWEREDETMGQPTEALIKSYDDLAGFKPPDPDHPDRFAAVKETIKRYGDRYYVASLALSGFTIMTFLHGYAETLQDLYIDREGVEKLADLVFAFETRVIERCADLGFDAVAFYDDWGDQHGLMIHPDLWREFFKPRYQEQFSSAHRHGLDVYFHSCGLIEPIIGDFIEIGVDMLNLSQPNLYDIAEIGAKFGGKVCFVCPVSYQTTSISGNKSDIYAAVKQLVDSLGSYNGGLVGYVESYASIGLSEENYQHCIDAFCFYGRY